VEIEAVYNGSCKPQSSQKQKDNYSTGYTVYETNKFIAFLKKLITDKNIEPTININE